MHFLNVSIPCSKSKFRWGGAHREEKESRDRETLADSRKDKGASSLFTTASYLPLIESMGDDNHLHGRIMTKTTKAYSPSVIFDINNANIIDPMPSGSWDRNNCIATFGMVHVVHSTSEDVRRHCV